MIETNGVDYWRAIASPAKRDPRESSPTASQERIRDWIKDALRQAHIVVIGIGAGSWIPGPLVCQGVGMLTLIDPGKVERSNTGRQIYFAHQIGAPKVKALLDLCLERAVAETEIRAHRRWFTAEWAKPIFEKNPPTAGIVFPDNNRARIEAARAFRTLGRPLVSVGLASDGFEIILQRPGQPGCIACQLPEDPAPAAAAGCVVAGVDCALALTASGKALDALTRLLMPARTLTWEARIEHLGSGMAKSGAIVPRADCPVCQGRGA